MPKITYRRPSTPSSSPVLEDIHSVTRQAQGRTQATVSSHIDLTSTSSAHPSRKILDIAPAVGVIHVPKCGGTSINASLAAMPGAYTGPIYFDWPMLPWVSKDPRVNQFSAETAQRFGSETELRAIIKKHRVVVGHYTARSLLRGGVQKFLVAVREPRSRILSAYGFTRQHYLNPTALKDLGVWGAAVQAALTDGIKTFMTEPSNWSMVYGLQARQLLQGGSISRWTRPTPAPKLVFHAMKPRYREISTRLAGCYWHSDGSRLVEAVALLVGSPAARYKTENVTAPDIASGEKLSKADLEVLELLCAPDMWLLERLMRDGHLPFRSEAALQREFENTCEKLGFKLP